MFTGCDCNEPREKHQFSLLDHRNFVAFASEVPSGSCAKGSIDIEMDFTLLCGVVVGSVFVEVVVS